MFYMLQSFNRNAINETVGKRAYEVKHQKIAKLN